MVYVYIYIYKYIYTRLRTRLKGDHEEIKKALLAQDVIQFRKAYKVFESTACMSDIIATALKGGSADSSLEPAVLWQRGLPVFASFAQTDESILQQCVNLNGVMLVASTLHQGKKGPTKDTYVHIDCIEIVNIKFKSSTH